MPRCGWCTWAGIFRWATTTRRWRRFRPAAADGAVEPDQAFAALAARRLILAETQRQRGALGQVETLDELHAVAIEEGIVTPYSSMIVLVNVRQERLLDELEAQGDRFAREFEEVGETVPESALDGDGGAGAARVVVDRGGGEDVGVVYAGLLVCFGHKSRELEGKSEHNDRLAELVPAATERLVVHQTTWQDVYEVAEECLPPGHGLLGYMRGKRAHRGGRSMPLLVR